ncbi:hypothetical protein C2845_PM03G17930 [Panicum miliaceum]|uniref:Late embryogenesis abundant protein LEA-2 subgroup domain-containing protein n=1 Tax=Panicum miliaceum TaxID=4540 RepID=A0A3L6TAY6_PANMI|nr:hypothetical protein C2845_PM03G17930 [Panicum miliaceum]
MGAGSYDEQEDDIDAGKNTLGSIMGFLFFSALIGFYVMLGLSMGAPPTYSVAIAGASGLDVDGATAFNPVFNVTVRVTSRSKDQACLHPATSVRVSYVGVPLAGGRVRPAAGGFCAPPRQHADLAAVARGKAVAVPGYLLDSLAKDMRTGEAVFEVTLMSPDGRYWQVLTCWGKIEDAAALEDSCTRSSVDARDLPQPGQLAQPM